MKIIKKILAIIFNPLNSLSIGKGNAKAADVFSKHAILVFFIALIISAVIFVVGYFVI